MENEKSRILIIDDEQALRESMGAVLEETGYLVGYAENGAQALKLIKESFYDILLVDYMLPEMNGVECIKQSLALSPDSVPVIITGSSSIEIAVEAMRIGAHDYLLKPLNMDDLQKVLSSILHEREEFRKGKLNLEQVIKSVSDDKEPDISTVVCSSDYSSSGKARKDYLKPVVLVLKDVAALFHLSPKQ